MSRTIEDYQQVLSAYYSTYPKSVPHDLMREVADLTGNKALNDLPTDIKVARAIYCLFVAYGELEPLEDEPIPDCAPKEGDEVTTYWNGVAYELKTVTVGAVNHAVFYAGGLPWLNSDWTTRIPAVTNKAYPTSTAAYQAYVYARYLADVEAFYESTHPESDPETFRAISNMNAWRDWPNTRDADELNIEQLRGVHACLVEHGVCEPLGDLPLQNVSTMEMCRDTKATQKPQK